MPRAKKQCPKPECRVSDCKEHTGAWHRSKNQVPISSSFRSVSKRLRDRSIFCGDRWGRPQTGDGCGKTFEKTGVANPRRTGKNTGADGVESTGAPEIDHIIPRASGGADSEDNYQALCKACHRVKTQRESRGHP